MQLLGATFVIMKNSRQIKKDDDYVENCIVMPVKQYIDEGNSKLMDFMQEFENGTLLWREITDRKIIELTDMKRDLERIKEDNIKFNKFKDEITDTIRYMRWTYKIMAFLAGLVVAFITFSEKVRILF